MVDDPRTGLFNTLTNLSEKLTLTRIPLQKNLHANVTEPISDCHNDPDLHYKHSLTPYRGNKHPMLQKFIGIAQ